MATIGLAMIVRNEAQIIRRCLDAARPLIDFICIHDTGSTDGTPRIIEEWCAREHMPNTIRHEPWQDFGANRSAVLRQSRLDLPQIDYMLMLDADDVLTFAPGLDIAAFKAALAADHYNIEIHRDFVRYPRPCLMSNRREYLYRGVLHEFLEAPAGAAEASAQGLWIESHSDGYRSRDPEKYRKDAELLEAARSGETDPMLRSRYTFYLAQSYRDCGESARAALVYLDRALMGGWQEEVFISLYSAAWLLEEAGRGQKIIVASYRRAIAAAPHRAEASHGLARYYRSTGRFRDGYETARAALHLAPPPDGLFVSPWIYEYGLLDEFSVCAYWIGRYSDSYLASKLALGGNLPSNDRIRISINMQLAADKLKEMENGDSARDDEMPQLRTDDAGRRA